MTSDTVTLIPISEIAILNPRSRNQVTFEGIVASIRTVGLKKPISVNRRAVTTDDGRQYDLICGQGRIEAFQALGESHRAENPYLDASPIHALRSRPVKLAESKHFSILGN